MPLDRFDQVVRGTFPMSQTVGRRMIEEFEEKMLSGIPLHCFNNPDDLKGVMVSYMIGQTVVVDGGATAW